MKVLILQGLPASGKSTYAKQLVKDNPGEWKRVNKDDLRSMLDVSVWSRENEHFVVELRNKIIISALEQGLNIIVDDTNLDPRHEADIRQLLTFNSNPKVNSATVELKFFDTPVDECIARDILRSNGDSRNSGYVGEAVIRRFASQLEGGKPRMNRRPPVVLEPWYPTPGLPNAIMVDIDGTIAHMTEQGRLRFGQNAPYSWKHVGEDAVDVDLRRLVSLIDTKYEVIIMSGRDAVCKPETEQWLKDNNIYYNEIHMRKEKDGRKDNIVKLELFNEHVRGKYNVSIVFDDRNQVVGMWRALGLKCYQVADGNF